MLNPNANTILLPLMALVTWTMVMWFWMLITRVPAIYKAKMRLDRNAPRGAQMDTLPAIVRWKADNYNHLMEQPTLFYAVAIVLYLIGEGTGFNTQLAWGYVLLRVIHSLVQSIINNIQYRFVLFVLSSIVLLVLIVNALRVMI